MKKLFTIATSVLLALVGAFLLALNLHKSEHAQTTLTGIPVALYPTVSTGAPTLTCSGPNTALYVQIDATNGRLWLCDNSSGTWAWDHLISPIAAGTSPTITTGTLLAGGCSAVVTVAMPQAVYGVNAVSVAPIYTTVPTNPGLLNITGWVSANGVVSIQACALTGLTTTSFTTRVLLY